MLLCFERHDKIKSFINELCEVYQIEFFIKDMTRNHINMWKYFSKSLKFNLGDSPGRIVDYSAMSKKYLWKNYHTDNDCWISPAVLLEKKNEFIVLNQQLLFAKKMVVYTQSS